MTPDEWLSGAAVVRRAHQTGERTGQALFNLLPEWVTRVVVDHQEIDPYERRLTRLEVSQWLNEHLIFEGLTIIAVFNGDTILAERPTE